MNVVPVTSKGSPQVTANLAELPVEILLIIFNYLDPTCLIRTISLVCKRFTTILLDEDYWKLIYFRNLKRRCDTDEVPILARYGLLKETWRCEPDIQWRDMVIKFENVHTEWVKPKEVLKLHSSAVTVDSVLLLQNSDICISGTRERCIDLWSVSNVPYIKSTVVDAHRGWVSCLESFENDYFISGAWDSTITYWNIGLSVCHPVWTLGFDRGIMSLAIRRGLVAVATYSPSIILVDPRIQESKRSNKYAVHEKALSSLMFWNNCVISVGRDQTLCSFDLRTLSVVNKVKISSHGGMPRCLAIRNGIAYVGDSKGYVHLFDANASFHKFQQFFATNQNSQVVSICPGLGHIITGSTDRTIRVIVPSKPTYEVTVIETDNEITTMSYGNGMLAAGKVNGAVELYKLK